MTNPTSNFGWQMPTSTDLVTDLPADFEVFGQAVDTDFVDLLGGANGYILSKASATDLDFAWIPNDQGDITNIAVTSPITGGGSSGSVTIGVSAASTSASGVVQLSDSTSTTSSVLASTPTATKSAYDLAAAAVPKSTVTTAGDIIYATGSSAVTRLGIGTNGQVLKSNGSAPVWGSDIGKIIQVVSATKTDTFTLSTQTFTDITGLSVSITPTSASSTILVMYCVTGNGGGTAMNIRALRGATPIGVATSTSNRTAMGSQLYNSDAGTLTAASWSYLDSPATTSATTYKIQVAANVSATTVYINRTPTDTDNSLFPRTVSSIWAMEIGA